MKANPGGTIEPEGIIGREVEIAGVWDALETRSVVLTAERRVGKTCLLRKMSGHPRDGWIPMLCWVEGKRHPIGCVEAIYEEADKADVKSAKAVWLDRFREVRKSLSGAESQGWKLPTVQEEWEKLLFALVEDVVENGEHPILLILDEFPLMVGNMIIDRQAALAMQFLDVLRRLRQRLEPSNRFRLILAGSIGLHILLKLLREQHGYKGMPINDTAPLGLSGMTRGDTELMCVRLLNEEGIERTSPSDFANAMYEATDGLPLYIQYVCAEFQSRRAGAVGADKIAPVLRGMMDRPEVEWFRDAADRIDTYYGPLGIGRHAQCALDALCREDGLVTEDEIAGHVFSQVTGADGTEVRTALDLLWQDQYLVRDTSQEARCYRIRYRLMRDWWRLNRAQ